MQHWISAANAGPDVHGPTRICFTFEDQHETVDVEWNAQVSTAAHGEAQAMGIRAGDRLVAIDGAPLDLSIPIANDLRHGPHEINHRSLTLTFERGSLPTPRLGGLPPELANTLFAWKLVLLHKGSDDEFRELLDDPAAAT